MAFRILMVDDSREALQLMTGVLESLSIEVLPLSDSRVAAGVINREKFDGIFLDLEMPNLDGLELAKAVRASTWNRTTPIVIVTGSNDRRVMAQCFSAGANFFLPKPVDRSRMASLLNTTRGTMLASRRGLERAALQVELKREDARSALPLQCANISERGLLLEGDPSLRPGAEIKLSFALPRQPERIMVLVTVVRVDDRGRVGVNFRNLRHADQQRIRTYVAEELARTTPLLPPSRTPQKISA
ncbi:MAG: response regulator [Terriglobales bacterium]